jgi:hypothetical protein
MAETVDDIARRIAEQFQHYTNWPEHGTGPARSLPEIAAEVLAPLIQRAEAAEKQYANLFDLHRGTLDETEKALLPEWQTASDEMTRDGNSSWCSAMRGAVAMIRERAEAAEREREELRTFVDQYRGVHDSQAGWVVGVEKCTCEICEAVRAASVPTAKEGT